MELWNDGTGHEAKWTRRFVEEEKRKEGLIVKGGAGQLFRLHTVVNEQLVLRSVSKCIHIAVCVLVCTCV